jgi:heme-degrading monooxygenase HmoA
MYCKTTKSQVSKDSVGSLRKWIQEKWAPLISSQEGFRGYYLAAQPDGCFVIIMLWDTEEQVQAWTDNPGHQALVPEFMAMTVAAVEMNVYQVLESG